jgi:predicted MFS family arabinose efflux permease
MASSLGAPMGGLINDTLGWRWAFYLQVRPLQLFSTWI